jgi:hypothetical protein
MGLMMVSGPAGPHRPCRPRAWCEHRYADLVGQQPKVLRLADHRDAKVTCGGKRLNCALVGQAKHPLGGNGAELETLGLALDERDKVPFVPDGRIDLGELDVERHRP